MLTEMLFDDCRPTRILTVDAHYTDPEDVTVTSHGVAFSHVVSGRPVYVFVPWHRVTGIMLDGSRSDTQIDDLFA